MPDRTARNPHGRDDWLREENPDVYHMLQALDGEEESFRWLAEKSQGLYLVTKGLAGDKNALAALESGAAPELDDLFGNIDNSPSAAWLGRRSPDLHLFFEAVKGDDRSLARLRRKRASASRLAQLLQGPYTAYHQRGSGEEPEGASRAGGQEAIPTDAAADVGCLVGELHLKQGEYARAVEAFTRAIKADPTPDAYEGRARAYRGLALQDEHRAEELRQTR